MSTDLVRGPTACAWITNGADLTPQLTVAV